MRKRPIAKLANFIWSHTQQKIEAGVGLEQDKHVDVERWLRGAFAQLLL